MKKARLVIAVLALALLAIPSTAGAKDRDHDKMPDKWEKKHGLSVKKANAKKDPDHDGLKNLREFKKRTDPRDADSDNDGLEDRDELRVGCDPRDRDSDDDGERDGDEFSGTVDSFDPATGVLTIRLVDGQNTISGRVTDATEIECEDDDADESAPLRAAHSSGDDEDNSGPGSDNSGPGSGDDDDDDRGDDDGDDDRGDDDDDDDREDCGTEALTEGRVVHEAELTTDENGDPVFREVELDR